MLIALVLAATLGWAAGQDTTSPFRWSGTLPAGATIEVRGIIGSIRAEAASGREVSVKATRTRGHRGLPTEAFRTPAGDSAATVQYNR